MTNLLLPYSFKRAGTIMLPFGIALWILTQKGVTADYIPMVETHQILRVAVLSISFFCFLLGWYFLAFSSERIEDEFVQKLRLQAFHAGALVQILFFFLLAVFFFVVGKEPANDTGFLILFMAAVFLYWFVYLFYFNGMLWLIKLRRNEE